MNNFARASAAVLCAVILTTTAAAHADSSGDMVRLSQHRLADLGYYNGSYDGVMGSLTATAIRDFQASNGLYADGRLDSNTYNLLVGMDYRFYNGTAPHLVYTTNYRQPVIIHYEDGSTAMATRYVTPVAYYHDAGYMQQVAYYGDAPMVTNVAYRSNCYNVAASGAWHYGDCE